MTYNFVAQGQEPSCSQVAILNALIWTGLSCTDPVAEVERLRIECKRPLKSGTRPERAVEVLHKRLKEAGDHYHMVDRICESKATLFGRIMYADAFILTYGQGDRKSHATFGRQHPSMSSYPNTIQIVNPDMWLNEAGLKKFINEIWAHGPGNIELQLIKKGPRPSCWQRFKSAFRLYE